MSSVLDWKIDLSDLREADREYSRSATPEQRQRIVEALDLLACDMLDAVYRVRELPMGRFRLSGMLKASVVQSCVVTLEPVPGTLEEAFDVEFRPADVMPDPGEGREERGVLDEADIEVLEGNTIEAGRIVFEHFAAALDPYPRRPGAEFRHEDAPAGRDASTSDNPFAILAKLKKQQKEDQS